MYAPGKGQRLRLNIIVMKLLHINASPRGRKSRTLDIAAEFLQSLRSTYPDLQVTELDLFNLQLPEASGLAIETKYALMSGGDLNESAKAAWLDTTAYAHAFLTYDAYLISCPMWNFTIPYKLKHYIDIIMQAGILFQFTQQGVEGLAINKKMYCITSRGSDYSQGSYLHQYDFLEPYLRSIFGMAGIREMTFINAQPMDYAPEVAQINLTKAKEEARRVAQL